MHLKSNQSEENTCIFAHVLQNIKCFITEKSYKMFTLIALQTLVFSLSVAMSSSSWHVCSSCQPHELEQNAYNETLNRDGMFGSPSQSVPPHNKKLINPFRNKSSRERKRESRSRGAKILLLFLVVVLLLLRSVSGWKMLIIIIG